MDVTLDLGIDSFPRQEWPMTYIAVRCLHCQSEQIVKRGKTAQGTQRYLCQNTLCAVRSFRLCRKFSFATICGMIFLHDQGCIMRESNDGGEFQRCPFPPRGYSHGSPLVCGVRAP